MREDEKEELVGLKSDSATVTELRYMDPEVKKKRLTG